MAGRARFFALLALFVGGTALGAGGAPSAFDLAGRYAHSFRNGTVDGETFTSTDSVTIVATGRRSAVFDIHTHFFNGHECNIGGAAALEGSTLVHRDPEMTGYGEGGSCEIRIRRAGGRISWDDSGTCSGYCGARGSLRGGGIAWSSRRALRPAERRRFLRDHERTRTLP